MFALSSRDLLDRLVVNRDSRAGLRPDIPGPPKPKIWPLRSHRTIFISDVHLGTRSCKADRLHAFLSQNRCQTLYLVGDIVDGWRLRHQWHWPEAHSRVLQAILEMVDQGTRVIYVPGNHDEFLRAYCGREIAGVSIQEEAVHRTADGREILVVHGDRYDGTLVTARWLARLGDFAYDLSQAANEWCNAARHFLGLEHWSLSAYLKENFKKAAEYIGRYETTVADDARARGFDGVVCGHIHHAAIKTIGGIVYHNDGDWVESCTALVEDARGHMEILRWASVDTRTAPAATESATGDLTSGFPA